VYQHGTSKRLYDSCGPQKNEEEITKRTCLYIDGQDEARYTDKMAKTKNRLFGEHFLPKRRMTPLFDIFAKGSHL
jgi:hypothetical protein